VAPMRIWTRQKKLMGPVWSRSLRSETQRSSALAEKRLDTASTTEDPMACS